MPKRDLYVEFLTAEGYRPALDDDGDVSFRHEGKTFFFDARDEDAEYFRLCLPNFWDSEDAGENVRALEVANELNFRYKAAKVFIWKGHAWASIEGFLPSPELFKPVFERQIAVLGEVAYEFRQRVRTVPGVADR